LAGFFFADGLFESEGRFEAALRFEGRSAGTNVALGNVVVEYQGSEIKLTVADLPLLGKQLNAGDDVARLKKLFHNA